MYVIGSEDNLCDFLCSCTPRKTVDLMINCDVYDCLVFEGLFTSRNQAKKNFFKEVHRGRNVFLIGKYKTQVIIYNCWN